MSQLKLVKCMKKKYYKHFTEFDKVKTIGTSQNFIKKVAVAGIEPGTQPSVVLRSTN